MMAGSSARNSNDPAPHRPPHSRADAPVSQQSRHDGAAQSSRMVYAGRSEEHTSELQSLMRISYAVFCLKKKKTTYRETHTRKTRQYKTVHNNYQPNRYSTKNERLKS